MSFSKISVSRLHELDSDNINYLDDEYVSKSNNEHVEYLQDTLISFLKTINQ